jgi:hypothetical protein
MENIVTGSSNELTWSVSLPPGSLFVHVIGSTRARTRARADHGTLSSTGQTSYACSNRGADAYSLGGFSLAGFRIVAPAAMPLRIR